MAAMASCSLDCRADSSRLPGAAVVVVDDNASVGAKEAEEGESSGDGVERSSSETERETMAGSSAVGIMECCGGGILRGAA